MSEVAISRFHGMSAELAVRIHATLEDYAREHGHAYDVLAMQQSDVRIEDLARDALTFGMDVWPHGSGDEEHLEGGNVISLSRARRQAPQRRSVGVARLALTTIGAVVGTTIVAAATTDAVDIPGFHRIASVVYQHNPAPEVERIVEQHGKLMRVHFSRRPGEPWDVVHVDSITPLDKSDAVAEFDDVKEHG